MVSANKRNEALRIESALLNKIAMLGTEKTAEAVGVDKSQISRWKRDWIPKFSMLLAVLEAVYDENSSAAPFAEIIVTKNRFGSLGTVYQRFCNGHFVACDQDEARQICTASNAPAARGRRYAQGADV